ncbi:M24 family metallopeptidase [Kolteria novifilia]|uniref:M24 family metallopeptidase n=1 Tax=Kolteria novifilia TaxID=2527975 RepID=UPI003AF3F2C7
MARALKSKGADALLVSDPVNVAYLTGFRGDSSELLVTKSRSLLLSDGRFTDQVAEECPGLDAVIRGTGESMTKAITKTLKKLGCRAIGFERAYLTVARHEALKEALPSAEWVGLENMVEDLRQIKDREEIAQIREAIAFAERAFGILRASLRLSDTEKSLADDMEHYLRRSGATQCAFPSIIAAGRRAALPHAIPTDQPIGESEFVLIDWGAKGTFYHSDLTRVLVTRKISRKFAKIYETVQKAQSQAIDAIRPGVTAGDVDAVARGVIEKAGHGSAFSHSLGHGIGMAVHEGPGLRRGSETVLEPGMVVTVEPGIYLNDWGGIRLEDDVLVTKDGHEVLTSVPKHLEETVV